VAATNPDMPELNIEDCKLKICGIALRAVGSKLYEPEASLCLFI
jgi:hypothetical protein